MLNACFINFRLKKMNQWITKRQEIAKKYDEALKDYVTIQPTTNGLNHTYHKYVIRFQNKEVRDRVKDRLAKLGAKVHYEKPLSESPMYQNIEHRKDKQFISKIICDTILTLPIHPYLTDFEIDMVVNTILILLEQEETKFLKSMKRLLGDDIIDKSLIIETTEPIYDYIVEKTYQTPEYIEDVSFKDKRKLKIAFNKFYENITRNTR